MEDRQLLTMDEVEIIEDGKKALADLWARKQQSEENKIINPDCVNINQLSTVRGKHMETIIKSSKQDVKISIDASFVIIGEKINPTGRKKLAAALKEGDFEYVKQLALKQVEAGADILDVNVGVPGIDEVD